MVERVRSVGTGPDRRHHGDELEELKEVVWGSLMEMGTAAGQNPAIAIKVLLRVLDSHPAVF